MHASSVPMFTRRRQTPLIAVDWGTSNFRACRLDANGGILDRRSSSMGLLRVPPGRFAEVLQHEVHDWLQDGERTLMLCGMVGSRSGWVETACVPCPASADDLARALHEVPFPGARAWIVPGVSCTTAHGVPELMRGEETAIIGALDFTKDSGLICLPGTHSKWVTVSQGRLHSFSTCMTGEVFAALRQHTILSRSMAAKLTHDPGAFTMGVEHSAQPGGLLHHVFRVRTLALNGVLATESAASFLSGLLIGTEVRATMPKQASVLLLGDDTLCGLYARAIQLCGGTSTPGGPDTAARGLFLLARQTESTGPQA